MVPDHDRIWENRIVRRAHVDPRELRPHPLNFRIHGDLQREAAESLLDTAGWVRDITVNERTGFLIDGHMRRELAIERGEALVPVTYVDLDENQELLALSMFDAIARLAATDAGKLAALRDRAGIAEGDPLAALVELAMANAVETAELPAGVEEEHGRAASFDRYENGDSRQIHLPLLATEYDEAREALGAIETAIKAKRNADVLFWLIERDTEAQADVG